MKRNPRKLAWTKSFRSAHGKEMTVDSTLTFAARRNVPVRYNRELVATTLKAMKRVSEIRQRRERAFYKKRMEGNKERIKAEDRKLVAENSHLLPKERVEEDVGEEIMDVDGQKVKASRKRGELKRRLLVDGGVEESMDVD